MKIETSKSQRFLTSMIGAYDNDMEVKESLSKAVSKRATDVLSDTMESAKKLIKYFGKEINIRVTVTIDEEPLITKKNDIRTI